MKLFKEAAFIENATTENLRKVCWKLHEGCCVFVYEQFYKDEN